MALWRNTHRRWTSFSTRAISLLSTPFCLIRRQSAACVQFASVPPTSLSSPTISSRYKCTRLVESIMLVNSLLCTLYHCDSPGRVCGLPVHSSSATRRSTSPPSMSTFRLLLFSSISLSPCSIDVRARLDPTYTHCPLCSLLRTAVLILFLLPFVPTSNTHHATHCHFSFHFYSLYFLHIPFISIFSGKKTNTVRSIFNLQNFFLIW